MNLHQLKKNNNKIEKCDCEVYENCDCTENNLYDKVKKHFNIEKKKKIS